MKVKKTETVKNYDKSREYISVLDGVRAFAILMVVIYHYWQQSWLSGIKIPFLQGTSWGDFPPRPFFANGSLFVEVFIILTGFCLFLPYAKSMFEKDINPDSPLTFYKKRAVRLLPSIWFSLIIWSVLFIRVTDYATTKDFVIDILDNFLVLRGTNLFSHAGTKFAAAGVLWTVTIEIFFYVIFPFVARLFKKWPVQTAAVMVIVGETYTLLRALPQIEAGQTDFHRGFLCYMGSFALGMMGAYTYHCIKRSQWMSKKYSRAIVTAISLAGLFSALWLIWSYYDSHRGADMQAKLRLPLALCFTVFIVALCFSAKWLRVIFANPVTKFLSGISLNIYIWHMFFALKFKEWRLPWYPDNTTGASAWPQSGGFEGHLTWQILYLVLCWTATIVTAVLVTYFIEKPVAKWLLKKKNGKNK